LTPAICERLRNLRMESTLLEEREEVGAVRDEIALWIGTHGLTRNDLLTATSETIDSAFDANALAALDFCRDWLAGQEEFIVQTSGSTGAPKPITLTRAQMIASAQATAAALGLAAGDPALVCLPTHYIAGRMMLVRGLVVGMPMTLVTPGANPLATAPAGAHFAFTAVVPLQLEAMLADDTPAMCGQLAGMKAILVGGGPLSPALAAAAQTCPAPIYHTYGMTETVTHVALRRVNGAAASEWFTPLPGVALRVDERGCLAIAGPMTQHAWVQTNDLAELRGDGAFRWLGRFDNVINTGGVKVQVETVEAAIAGLGLPALAGRRFFLAGLPDPRLGQVVTLVVERGDGLAPAETDALLAMLRGALPRFDAPRQIVTVARFAETPTGKIDRAKSLG
jgi:O-succinylbenzoic acid--CoA ligase